eukprot:2680850-Karenia_brevis.AAC.1
MMFIRRIFENVHKNDACEIEPLRGQSPRVINAGGKFLTTSQMCYARDAFVWREECDCRVKTKSA